MVARGGWRTWQATTVAHRLASLVGGEPGDGGGPAAPPAARVASVASAPLTPAAPAAGPLAVAAAHARATLPDGDRARYDALVAAATRGDESVASLPARALASGAPVAALEALAALWPELTPRERSQVAAPLGHARPGPLRVGDAPARQTDETTCGSAVLAMLAAAGDPLLALWLVTGRLVPEYRPPETHDLAARDLAADDPGDRLAALQHAVKRASTRGALGPLPWPAALGTPPWGAARVARYPGVRWTHLLVDDTDADQLAAVLARADAALAAGVPVPVFTGGDVGMGLATAVPRHVVLLVPGAAGVPAVPEVADGAHPGYAVYEPSRGQVHRVPRAALVAGSRHPALGGWAHVCWAVLPA
jgi:hypothetical protein